MAGHMAGHQPAGRRSSSTSFEERDWLSGFRDMQRAGKTAAGRAQAGRLRRVFHQPSGLADNAENLVEPPGYYERLAPANRPNGSRFTSRANTASSWTEKPVFPRIQRPECTARKSKAVPGPAGLPRLGLQAEFAGLCFRILPPGRPLAFDGRNSESMGIDRLHPSAAALRPVIPPKTQFEDIGDPAGVTRPDGRKDRGSRFCRPRRGNPNRGTDLGSRLRIECASP